MERSLLAVALVFSVFAASEARAQAPAPSTGWAAPEPPPLPEPASASASASASTPKPSSSLKIEYETHESVKAPEPAKPAPAANPDAGEKKRDELTESRFLHGFRLGYSYIANYDTPLPSLDGKTFKDKTGVRAPHNFLLGYEVLIRMMGHSWLNVILLANGMLAGLEQSKVLPSGNTLIGFEFNNSFQIGVGAHLTPLKGQEAHVAVAGGWTPRVGGFYVPVHAFVIPDVDGNHRTGMLTGVTW